MNRPLNHREPLSPCGSHNAGAVSPPLSAPATHTSAPFDTECQADLTPLDVWATDGGAVAGDERRHTASPVGRQSERRSVTDADAGLSPAPRNPDCIKCGRGYWFCICGCPEPEQENFRPALNRDPDSGWALAERSAVK